MDASDIDLTGQVAFVTGGGGGIGKSDRTDAMGAGVFAHLAQRLRMADHFIDAGRARQRQQAVTHAHEMFVDDHQP